LRVRGGEERRSILQKEGEYLDSVLGGPPLKKVLAGCTMKGLDEEVCYQGILKKGGGHARAKNRRIEKAKKSKIDTQNDAKKNQ